MLTKAQIALYWREWARVRLMAGDEADDRLRHELHARALGVDKSSRALNNREFDLVLGAFRAVSRPADMNAQLAQINQERKRLLWKIRNEQRVLLGLFLQDPDAYIAEVLRERFHARAPEALSHQPGDRGSELRQLVMTLAARIDKMRQDAGWTVPQMHALAGLGHGKEAAHA